MPFNAITLTLSHLFIPLAAVSGSNELNPIQDPISSEANDRVCYSQWNFLTKISALLVARSLNVLLSLYGFEFDSLILVCQPTNVLSSDHPVKFIECSQSAVQISFSSHCCCGRMHLLFWTRLFFLTGGWMNFFEDCPFKEKLVYLLLYILYNVILYN